MARTEVSIRQALTSDTASIAHIARRTWKVAYADIILPANQERLLGQWYSLSALEEAILRERRSWFFVAVANEDAVGFAQFILRGDGDGQLTRIYVLPEWQHQGNGGRLLALGLVEIRKQGARKVYVAVERDNQPGRHFYEKHGFQPEREYPIELPEQALTLVEYVLLL